MEDRRNGLLFDPTSPRNMADTIVRFAALPPEARLAMGLASCIVILFTPILSNLDVLQPYRMPYRLSGAFSDPNDAGFIGCMTTTLALTFLGSLRRRAFAYLGLTMGCAVILGSFSRTAVFVLVAILIFFLLLNGRDSGRGPTLRWLLVLGLIGIVAYSTLDLTKIMDFRQQKKIRQIMTILGSERPDNAIEKILANRLPLWQLGLEKSIESPIVGHGLDRLRSMDRGHHRTSWQTVGCPQCVPAAGWRSRYYPIIAVPSVSLLFIAVRLDHAKMLG